MLQDTGAINGADLQSDAQNTESGFGGITGGAGNVFTIPDEYSQKDWARNFDGQTGDVLKAGIFKTLDEKFANTPVIPENAESYALNDILKNSDGLREYEYPPETLTFFGDKFKELGLSKEQGQQLLKTYTQFEVDQFNKYTNADALEKSINTMFLNNQAQRKTVESLLREFLPKQDQAFLQQTAPNYVIEMFYKVAKGLSDKYGYKEGTANANKPAGFRMSEADRDAEYNRIVSEMEALKTHPHKTEEKENLQRQLLSLFR